MFCKTYLYDTDLFHALQYYIILGYFVKYYTVVKHVKMVVFHFQEHFLSEGHNGLICNVKIIFIDKTDLSRIKLKTFWLESLNIKEQVKIFYFEAFQ